MKLFNSDCFQFTFTTIIHISLLINVQDELGRSMDVPLSDLKVSVLPGFVPVLPSLFAAGVTVRNGPEMPKGISNFAAVYVPEYHAIVIAGGSSRANVYLKESHTFSLSSQSFAPLPDLERNWFGGHSGRLLDGRVYLVGANAGNAGNVGGEGLHLFTPRTGSWRFAPLPASFTIGFRPATVVDAQGVLHCFGGRHAPQTMQSYHPTLDLWVKSPVPLPHGMLAHGAALDPTGQFVLFGGFHLEQNTSVKTMWFYDWLREVWVPGPPMPEARCDFAYAYDVHQIVVCGGGEKLLEDLEPTFADVWVFSFRSHRWTVHEKALPNQFRAASAVLVDGVLHCFGGSCRGVRRPQHWEIRALPPLPAPQGQVAQLQPQPAESVGGGSADTGGGGGGRGGCAVALAPLASAADEEKAYEPLARPAAGAVAVAAVAVDGREAERGDLIRVEAHSDSDDATADTERGRGAEVVEAETEAKWPFESPPAAFGQPPLGELVEGVASAPLVTALGEGRFQVCFTPLCSGRFYLEVLLRGRPVADSPYCCESQRLPVWPEGFSPLGAAFAAESAAYQCAGVWRAPSASVRGLASAELSSVVSGVRWGDGGSDKKDSASAEFALAVCVSEVNAKRWRLRSGADAVLCDSARQCWLAVRVDVSAKVSEKVLLVSPEVLSAFPFASLTGGRPCLFFGDAATAPPVSGALLSAALPPVSEVTFAPSGDPAGNSKAEDDTLTLASLRRLVSELTFPLSENEELPLPQPRAATRTGSSPAPPARFRVHLLRRSDGVPTRFGRCTPSCAVVLLPPSASVVSSLPPAPLTSWPSEPCLFAFTDGEGYGGDGESKTAAVPGSDTERALAAPPQWLTTLRQLRPGLPVRVYAVAYRETKCHVDAAVNWLLDNDLAYVAKNAGELVKEEACGKPWVCVACTLENAASAHRCDACGAESQSPLPSYLQAEHPFWRQNEGKPMMRTDGETTRTTTVTFGSTSLDLDLPLTRTSHPGATTHSFASLRPSQPASKGPFPLWHSTQSFPLLARLDSHRCAVDEVDVSSQRPPPVSPAPWADSAALRRAVRSVFCALLRHHALVSQAQLCAHLVDALPQQPDVLWPSLAQYPMGVRSFLHQLSHVWHLADAVRYELPARLDRLEAEERKLPQEKSSSSSGPHAHRSDNPYSDDASFIEDRALLLLQLVPVTQNASNASARRPAYLHLSRDYPQDKHFSAMMMADNTPTAAVAVPSPSPTSVSPSSSSSSSSLLLPVPPRAGGDAPDDAAPILQRHHSASPASSASPSALSNAHISSAAVSNEPHPPPPPPAPLLAVRSVVTRSDVLTAPRLIRQRSPFDGVTIPCAAGTKPATDANADAAAVVELPRVPAGFADHPLTRDILTFVGPPVDSPRVCTPDADAADGHGHGRGHAARSLQLLHELVVRHGAARLRSRGFRLFDLLLRQAAGREVRQDLLWLLANCVQSLITPRPEAEAASDTSAVPEAKLPHFLDGLHGCGRANADMVRCEWHSLSLQLTALLKRLLEKENTQREADTDLILQLLECWRLRFEPQDLLFLHRSQVFPLVRRAMAEGGSGGDLSAPQSLPLPTACAAEEKECPPAAAFNASAGASANGIASASGSSCCTRVTYPELAVDAESSDASDDKGRLPQLWDGRTDGYWQHEWFRVSLAKPTRVHAICLYLDPERDKGCVPRELEVWVSCNTEGKNLELLQRLTVPEFVGSGFFTIVLGSHSKQHSGAAAGVETASVKIVANNVYGQPGREMRVREVKLLGMPLVSSMQQPARYQHAVRIRDGAVNLFRSLVHTCLATVTEQQLPSVSLLAPALASSSAAPPPIDSSPPLTREPSSELQQQLASILFSTPSALTSGVLGEANTSSSTSSTFVRGGTAIFFGSLGEVQRLAFELVFNELKAAAQRCLQHHSLFFLGQRALFPAEQAEEEEEEEKVVPAAAAAEALSEPAVGAEEKNRVTAGPPPSVAAATATAVTHEDKDEDDDNANDAYVYELLCMVTALSRSVPGQRFIANPEFLAPLFTLFFAGTPRMQRELLIIFARVLTHCSPDRIHMAAESIVVGRNVHSLLELLLAALASALSCTVRDSTVKHEPHKRSDTLLEWWPRRLPSDVAQGLSDLLKHCLLPGHAWEKAVSRCVADALGRATNLMAASFLPPSQLDAWLALGALSLLARNPLHAPTSSLIARVEALARNVCFRPTTLALPSAYQLGVDLCDSTCRLKVSQEDGAPSMICSVDVRQQRAAIEFRATGRSSQGVCRFCGVTLREYNLLSHPPSAALAVVCSAPDCQSFAAQSCIRMLACGHPCRGVRDEETCLPCLHPSCATAHELKQDADAQCNICYTDSLGAQPCVLLEKCKHVYHAACVRTILRTRLPGARVTLGFMKCPVECAAELRCAAVRDLTDPLDVIATELRRRALVRLQYEKLDSHADITAPSGAHYNDPVGFALHRFAYYLCFKCNLPYYGGEYHCIAAGGPAHINPSEVSILEHCSLLVEHVFCSFSLPLSLTRVLFLSPHLTVPLFSWCAEVAAPFGLKVALSTARTTLNSNAVSVAQSRYGFASAPPIFAILATATTETSAAQKKRTSSLVRVSPADLGVCRRRSRASVLYESITHPTERNSPWAVAFAATYTVSE